MWDRPPGLYPRACGPRNFMKNIQNPGMEIEPVNAA